ncbi:MAG: hypothetical protein AAFQ89_21885 [Cyanobacteria bacterium J06626_18]
MKTLRLTSRVSEDGLVQIRLPDHHNEDVEILVVYQTAQPRPKRQWSQAFLDLFGAWQGVPLARKEQELPQEREPLV